MPGTPVEAEGERLGFFTLAVAAFAFIAPLDGFRNLIGFLGFKPVTVAGYLLAALALPYLPSMVRNRHPFLGLWAASLAVTSLVTFIVAVAAGGSLDSRLLTLWQMVVLTWLAGHACASQRARLLVLRWFLLGFTVALLVYVYLHRTGGAVSEIQDRVLSVRGYHAHRAGLHAAAIFILSLGTMRLWPRWLRIVLIAITLPTALYVMLVTNTRIVHLSMAAGLTVYLLFGSRAVRGSRLKSALLMAGAGALVLAVAGGERVGQLVDSQLARWDSGASMTFLTSHRTDIANAVWDMALAQPLGHGISLETLQELAKRVPALGVETLDAHNEFLQTLLVGGFPALLLFLLAHGRLLLDTTRACRMAGVAWPLAFLVGYEVSLFGGTNAAEKASCIVLGLVSQFAYAGVMARRTPEAAPAAGPSRSLPEPQPAAGYRPPAPSLRGPAL
jgi:hypothetical protein